MRSITVKLAALLTMALTLFSEAPAMAIGGCSAAVWNRGCRCYCMRLPAGSDHCEVDDADDGFDQGIGDPCQFCIEWGQCPRSSTRGLYAF